MTTTEILMIMATFLSPLIAVQVTRYLDDRNQRIERKLAVFKTLMSTRAYNISIAHVQALNSIDLEFSTKKDSEKAVIEIWHQYLDHLGSTQIEPNTWGLRRIELFVDLMYLMGKSLKYDFNKTQIKNGTYLPTAHTQQEDEQSQFRILMLELLEGKRSIPMYITNLPDSPNEQK